MSRKTAVDMALDRIIAAYKDGDKFDARLAVDDLYEEAYGDGHNDGYQDGRDDAEEFGLGLDA